MLIFCAMVAEIILAVQLAWAGPPFTTDDPEPVEYQHWELYVASQIARDKNGWSGTSPHVEVNYGALPNLQLHLIAPVSFFAPFREPPRFGYGDTEIGLSCQARRYTYEGNETTERDPIIPRCC